jgi:hypothetical protein
MRGGSPKIRRLEIFKILVKMRPAVGAQARAYIRTSVIQKPVLRIRKYAMLRFDAFVFTQNCVKIQEIL